MLTGQNGILNRAGEAKEETERSQNEELEKLAGMEALTNINGYEYQGVHIPAGYIVSSKEGENSLEDGLVIKDASGNEFVWVEVPRASVHDAYSAYSVDGSLTDTATIEVGLKKYTETYNKSDFSGGNWTDDWYAWDETQNKLITENSATTEQKLLTNGCGLTLEEYKRNKEKMLKSIYENEGFWISRYEIGDETQTNDSSKIIAVNGSYARTEEELKYIGVSKPNQVPYAYVTCSQAQILANKMAQGDLTSSLLFGIQWDLVCKYLEVKLGSNVTVNEKNIINEDSRTWGNYYNSEITLDRGKYAMISNLSTWFNNNQDATGPIPVEKGEKKANIIPILLTTGASDDTKKQNIYDLAGNLFELTLEQPMGVDVDPRPCAGRGGSYAESGSSNFVIACGVSSTSDSNFYTGFRAALY